MEKLITIVVRTPETRSQNDDDFADRLSSRYTVVMLISFAIFIGITQYVRKPITCWAPVHFTGTQIKFSNQYCWIKNTYYVPWEEDVPEASVPDSKRRIIPYYQWISFILLVQAAFFYFPSAFWHGLNSRSGVDADNILEVARHLSTVGKMPKNETLLQILTSLIVRFLDMRRTKSYLKRRRRKAILIDCSCVCGPRVSYYMSILFFASKILYIANIAGQLMLLQLVMAHKYPTFAFAIDIARGISTGTDWTEESYVAFPRVTMCDMKIRGQDIVNVHAYALQCVLPINIYNEKIYLFLWFWMIGVGGISIISLLTWFIRMVLPCDRQRFVTTHIDPGLMSSNKDFHPDEVTEFINKHLRIDGVLLLRLISHNIDGVAATDITTLLFEKWLQKKHQADQLQNDGMNMLSKDSIEYKNEKSE